MNNDDFTAILKSNIDEMKENTLSNLLNHDHEYKKLCKLQGNAEAEYLKLNLSTEQKEVITKLLTTTDSQNMEYSTLSYLAGLFDSHNWKKLLSIVPAANQTATPKPIISAFYNGEIVPIEHNAETPSTRSIWNTIYDAEEAFEFSLTDEAKSTYQTMCAKRMEGMARTSEDYFSYGFQLGMKMIIDSLC